MRATRKGQCKLAADQGNLVGAAYCMAACKRKDFLLGKASPEEGAGRTVMILTTG
jgi:hypothetical protein